MTSIEEEQDAQREVQNDFHQHREKVHDCPDCCGCGCCGGEH